VVEVAGQGRPHDERRAEEDALQEAQEPDTQHLVSPDHQAPPGPETEVHAGYVLSLNLDPAEVPHPESSLMAHPDVGNVQGLEAHDLGRHRVHGHRIGAGQQDVPHPGFHGPGPGPVPAHRAVHDGEDAGMELLLHDHEVHKDLVDVLVGVVADLLQQAPEGVLDRPGCDRVAVGLDRGQVDDALADEHPGDLYPLGKDPVQLEKLLLEGVDRPLHLGQGIEGKAVLPEDGKPAVVLRSLDRVGDHGLVLHREKALLPVSRPQERPEYALELPGLGGAGGEILGPGKVELEEGLPFPGDGILHPGVPEKHFVVIEHGLRRRLAHHHFGQRLTPSRVEDEDGSRNPQRQVRQQGLVLDDQGFRAPAFRLLVDEVQVAEYPVEDEWNGPDQVPGPELGHGLAGDGVQGIGDHRRSGHHGDHLVQQAGVVLLEDRPVVPGLLVQENQLVAALAQGKEKGQQDGADEKPGRDLDPDGQAAGRNPDEKTRGDEENVQDDHVLQPEGIGELQGQVAEGGGEKFEPNPQGTGQAECQKEEKGPQGRPPLQLPRGNRPAGLYRMEPVLLHVLYVVEDVGRPAQQAEAGKGGRGPGQQGKGKDVP